MPQSRGVHYMSKDWVADIGVFHQKFDVAEYSLNQGPPREVQQLRYELIKEESKEVRDAIQKRDIIGIADGCADLIVVTIGCARVYGIPMRAVWDEVQRSNLSKLGRDGRPVYRADGKVLKGEDFSPPDLETILGAYGVHG
jgi:predicted HAD superfamily Cof-like phosphohydrolase